MDHETELDCVRRAQAGDRAAFSALVDRYWSPVRAWLDGLAGDREPADDLAQETFLKAWLSLRQLSEPAAFRVWVFRIAKTEALAQLRKPARRTEALTREPATRQPGPAQALETAEAGAAFAAAVRGLADPYRTAYLLWTHDQMAYTEMSRVLETTEETARWRVCEARRRLARAMAPHLGGKS